MKRLGPYIQLARPSHWFKNIFVLPGILIALMLGQPLPSNFLLTWVSGFVAVCLIASANYVLNEWLDAPYDQFHPLKKNRPSVTGRVTRRGVYLEYALLVLVGVGLAALVNPLFLLSAVWLLAMGLIYNVPPVRSKDKPYVDVLSESINNVIRFLLGWALVTSAFLPNSTILISYWMGGAFLMGVKRLAEYRFIGNPATAGLYRKSFQYYSSETLLTSILFYAMMALFFIGLFIVKYKLELLLSVPLFAILFCWYFLLGLRPNSIAQRPEALYRELPLLLYIIFLVVVSTLLLFVDLPQLNFLLRTDLIPFVWPQ